MYNIMRKQLSYKKCLPLLTGTAEAYQLYEYLIANHHLSHSQTKALPPVPAMEPSSLRFL